MEFFAANIKFLRKSKKLTQAEIKDRLGIEATTWSNYERGKSFPNLEQFFRISQFFGVSEGDFLRFDLSKGGTSKNLNQQNDGSKGGIKGGIEGGTRGKDQGKFPIFPGENPPILESNVKNNVFDLTTKAAAGFVGHIMHDGDKFKAKPNLYLPGLGPGVHIRVPVAGDSMHSTIKDGDKPVATLVTAITEIRQGDVYLLLDRDDGLVCKRVYWADNDTFDLVSDNEIYPSYKRHLSDIAAIFKVQEVHTRDLRPYNHDLRREMREIRAEMADIRRLIGKN